MVFLLLVALMVLTHVTLQTVVYCSYQEVRHVFQHLWLLVELQVVIIVYRTVQRRIEIRVSFGSPSIQQNGVVITSYPSSQ